MKILAVILCLHATLPGSSGNDVVIGILGNSVSIDCKLPVTDGLVWETAKKGIIAIDSEFLVSNTNKYVLERYGGERESLVIHDVTLTDETIYRCYSLDNKNDAYATSLNVLVRPSVMNIVQPQTPAIEGTEVTLVCKADGGKPLPVVKWYWRDSEGYVSELKGVESRTRYNNGTGSVVSVLKLNVTADMFMTSFICNVTVPVFYEETLVTRLDVHLIPQPPMINGYDGSFDENSELNLECISTGSHPTAAVSWRINGSPTGDTEYVVIPESNNTTTVKSYLARRLSRDFDGSVVTCVVTNSVVIDSGLDPIVTNVTLHMSHAPNVTAISKQYVINKGGDVTLSCDIDALPVTDIDSVYWTHNGILISEGNYELKNTSVLNLNLTGVNRSDAGNYTCHASNRVGSSSSQLKLSVTYTPQCSTKHVQRLPVNIGGSVRLHCSMYANPVDVIMFWRNQLTQNAIMSIKATQDVSREELVYGTIDMKIKSQDQYTTIECIGTNTAIGHGQPCIFKIEPPSPAEAPENCTVSTSDHKMAISCRAGFDGGSKQSFILQKRFQDNFKTVSNKSVPEFPLLYKENITVRVCAVNEEYRDVLRCSAPVHVEVFSNEGDQDDEVIVARNGNTLVYLIGGITGFVGMLIITAIMILLTRKRHKNGTSRRTTPLGDIARQTGGQQTRLRTSEKWWNKLQPTSRVIHGNQGNITPSMSRSTGNGLQVVCSTPYHNTNQPVFNVVGNSPILPEDIQTQGQLYSTTPESYRFNSLGESTGFILSPMLCQSSESSTDYCQHMTQLDNTCTVRKQAGGSKPVYNKTDVDTRQMEHKQRAHTVEDTKSIDICAVTLDEDYSCGDIADVLDNEVCQLNNQTFDLDKPNSNIVINGTTLSFEVDYSDSETCATFSNASPRDMDMSSGFESNSNCEGDTSYISNFLYQLDDRSQDGTTSSEVHKRNIINKTYNISNKHDNTNGDSISDMEVTLCPDVIQYERSDTAFRHNKCTGRKSDVSTNMYLDNGSCFSQSDETVCDIDRTLTIINESNPDLLVAEYDCLNVSEPQDAMVTDESKLAVLGQLRSDSFRTAIDNSTVNHLNNTDTFLVQTDATTADEDVHVTSNFEADTGHDTIAYF